MIKELDKTYYESRAKEFEVTKDMEDETVTQMIEDLTDTLKSLPDRYYLCANEIGYNLRAAVVRFEDEYLEFLNPLFQEKLEPSMIREVDPDTGKEYIVPRFKNCMITYQTKTGEVKTTRLGEDASIVFCQLNDCLNGLHDPDYGLEVIPEFDQATDEERAEVVDAYLKGLTELADEMDKDLSEDDELKKYWTKFKFDEAVAEGKVEFDKEEEQPLNRKQRRMINKLAKKLGRKKK